MGIDSVYQDGKKEGLFVRRLEYSIELSARRETLVLDGPSLSGYHSMQGHARVCRDKGPADDGECITHDMSASKARRDEGIRSSAIGLQALGKPLTPCKTRAAIKQRDFPWKTLDHPSGRIEVWLWFSIVKKASII